jgi:hypothetical protein
MRGHSRADREGLKVTPKIASAKAALVANCETILRFEAS